MGCQEGAYPYSFVKQEVLHKFEYFPIKCRIQRAGEAYSKFVDSIKKEQEDEALAEKKLKVQANFSSARFGHVTV